MSSHTPAQTGTDIFRLLVERVREYAIFALDTRGRVASWNLGAERLKGYSADEIIGQPYEIFFPPESREIDLPNRLLRRAREEGQVEDEGWRMRKDGTRFWADALLTAVRDDEGELLGYAKVTRDLTERRLHEQHERELVAERVARRMAEEQRSEAERRAREEAALRAVAHALTAAEGLEEALGRVAELALSLGDADAAYIERVHEGQEFVELVAAAGTGHPPVGTRVPFPGSLTEELSHAADPVILDDFTAVDRRPMAQLVAEGCGACRGLVAPLHSGQDLLGALVLVRSAARPPFSPEGTQRVMLLADMGALALRRALVVQQAEQHAREERALRHAAASVSAAFTVEEMLPQIARSALEATGADGSVVERLSADNQTLEIVVADGTIRLPLGSSIPYAGSYAEYVIERGEPVVIPRLAGIEDRPVPLHWKETCPDCSALLLGLVDAGEIIGALLLLRSPERSPFRATEIARARTFANLVSLAFRKVHLLEESERRRLELERVMESRARLVRGFSHDVKNPLSASLGFVELLLDGYMGAPSPEQQRALERAGAGIRSAVALIDDLVDLARAESGQIEVAMEAVDLRAVARELAGQYSAAAEQKDLAVTLDLPRSVPTVQTDPTRVRQILGNLLSNAVKYTPVGGAIDLRLNERSSRREGGADGPWLALHVIDTGPGIAPEDQERIFEEFTRLAPGAAEGAGLGLAISRRIARLLGGDLTVESEPGHGSNFTLWLPLAAKDELRELAADD